MSVPVVDGARLLHYPARVSEAADRMEGTLVSWDDARGFGFAEAPGVTGQIFVHIKFFRARHVRPASGDRLRFTLGAGRDGGPAAADAEIVGAPPPPEPGPAQTTTIVDVSRLVAATSILVGALMVVTMGRAPAWFGALYLVMSLGSGLAYWLDKEYARAGRSRVRETSLHLADGFFGIAGGLFAQHVFRHKTRKNSFRYVTRLIWVMHATLLAALLGGLIPFGEISPFSA